jgi:DNA-binding NtrC family response regulator
MTRTQETPDSAGPSVPGLKESTRILVADDHETIRRMLSLLFARAPRLQVSTAADGLAAQASIPGVRPHLIVTDLAMPRLAGAGGWLSKPPKVAELLHRVDQLLAIASFS